LTPIVAAARGWSRIAIIARPVRHVTILEHLGPAKTDRYLLFAERPEDVASGNWIQTDPQKGWFVLFLLQPSPAILRQIVATREDRGSEVNMKGATRLKNGGVAMEPTFGLALMFELTFKAVSRADPYLG
jgi:hypothetical protein